MRTNEKGVETIPLFSAKSSISPIAAETCVTISTDVAQHKVGASNILVPNCICKFIE